MFVKIGGQQMYLWRAVDSEGEVLDMLVQSRRDKAAAMRLMRKLIKNQGMAPMEIVTDQLKSYGSAARELGLGAKHIQGKRKNNRAEGSQAHPTARAEDARLPLDRPGPTFPFCPRRRRQYLLDLPPPDLRCHTSQVPS